MTTTTPHPEGIGAAPVLDFRKARTAILIPLHGDPYGMGWQIDHNYLRGRLTEADQSIDYGTGELAEFARNWERPTAEALLQMLATQLGYHVFKCEAF